MQVKYYFTVETIYDVFSQRLTATQSVRPQLHQTAAAVTRGLAAAPIGVLLRAARLRSQTPHLLRIAPLLTHTLLLSSTPPRHLQVHLRRRPHRRHCTHFSMKRLRNITHPTTNMRTLRMHITRLKTFHTGLTG